METILIRLPETSTTEETTVAAGWITGVIEEAGWGAGGAGKGGMQFILLNDKKHG